MGVQASFAATLLFACNAVASSTFLNPHFPDPVGDYRNNPIWSLGDTITVQWSTDLDKTDLVVWQDYPHPPPMNPGLSVYIDTKYTASSVVWTLGLGGLNSTIPSGEQAVLFFALYPAGQNSPSAISHYFNVSKPETTSAYTSPSATSHPPSSSASSAIAPTSSEGSSSSFNPTATSSSSTASALVLQPSNAATTPTPQPTESGSGGLSTGAVAGIAVGCTIGGLALLGGLGFLLWKRNARNKGHSEHQAPPPPTPQFEKRDVPMAHEADGSTTQQAPVYEAP